MGQGARSTTWQCLPESCPACGSTRYKKNGHTRHGKQNHLCKNCERQFSAGADNLLISAERSTEIANLLRERLSGECLGLAVFAGCLAAGGLSFGYWIVLPRALRWLTNYESGTFLHLIQAKSYYSFVVTVLVGIVIVFQLPLVVLGLVGLGVLTSRTLRRHRRVGYLLVAVIALALPGPDPITTFLELLPMWALFESSIWLAVAFERRQRPLNRVARLSRVELGHPSHGRSLDWPCGPVV